MSKTRLLAGVALLACGLAITGCWLFVGAAVGAGGVVYVKGEMKSVEQVTLDHAWSAVKKTAREGKLFVVEEEKDQLSAKLVVRTAADKKITITLKSVSNTITDIRVRVGLIGDEPESRMMLDKIKRNF